MREKVKEMLLNALEKELAVEGEGIRVYLIETLTDTIVKLGEEEVPQLDADELKKAFDEWYAGWQDL